MWGTGTTLSIYAPLHGDRIWQRAGLKWGVQARSHGTKPKNCPVPQKTSGRCQYSTDPPFCCNEGDAATMSKSQGPCIFPFFCVIREVSPQTVVPETGHLSIFSANRDITDLNSVRRQRHNLKAKCSLYDRG